MRARALIMLGCGALATSSPAAETVSYTYDARGRLVEVSRSGSVNDGLNTRYGYDKSDNRTNVTVVQGTPTPTPTPTPKPTPSPSFAVSDASVSEGGSLVFTVTKTGTTSAAFTIDYATTGGTATSGTDFSPASGTLGFLAADTSKPVNVTTTQDSSPEANETVLLSLSSPSGGATITDTQGVGTIVNDDSTNQPPVANQDSMTLPACGFGTKNVVANDTDPEGHYPLSVIAVTGAIDGDAFLSGTTSIGYQSAGTSGEVLTYTVSDSLGATANGTLVVSISGGICQ